jgi:hypothetical protein
LTTPSGLLSMPPLSSREPAAAPRRLEAPPRVRD